MVSAGSASKAETHVSSQRTSRLGRELRPGVTHSPLGTEGRRPGCVRRMAGGTVVRFCRFWKGQAITHFTLAEVFKICCCPTPCFPEEPHPVGMILWGSRAPAVP